MLHRLPPVKLVYTALISNRLFRAAGNNSSHKVSMRRHPKGPTIGSRNSSNCIPSSQASQLWTFLVSPTKLRQRWVAQLGVQSLLLRIKIMVGCPQILSMGRRLRCSRFLLVPKYRILLDQTLPCRTVMICHTATI